MNLSAPSRRRRNHRRIINDRFRNIVLVHGGFVDGSGWRGVYDALTADGYKVSVVQNQTLSLESDVETTTNALDLQDGPAILVGHSYGGVVITEAERTTSGPGVHLRVRTDRGQSVSTMLGDAPADAPRPPILPPGRLPVPGPGELRSGVRHRVPAPDSAFMANSQVPWGVEALNGTIAEPAWRQKPSWYLLTTRTG